MKFQFGVNTEKKRGTKWRRKNSKIRATPENLGKETWDVGLEAFEKRKVFRFWAHLHDAGGGSCAYCGGDGSGLGGDIAFSVEVSAVDLPLLVCKGVSFTGCSL